MSDKIAQIRASLCPGLTPKGLDDPNFSRLGLLAHQRENDDASSFNGFNMKKYTFPSEKELVNHVIEGLGSLKLNEETSPDVNGKFYHVTPGKQLNLCSPFLLSLFVALGPLESDSVALTPCQPTVHLRPASLPQDLLTPEVNEQTYIKHISDGGDKDVFCQPLETIIYSTNNSNFGAAISPVESLDRCQFRRIVNESLANHIKLDDVKDAFHLLVADKGEIAQFIPKHLEDDNDLPIVLFFALLAGLHKKYNGLQSDNDWLALLSALSDLPEPQHGLSVSSTADLHYITRVLFAEKVRCKIAIAKGLRRFLLTYHISHSEFPPETLTHILNPRLLPVSETGIFSDPCPLSVTATTGHPSIFEQLIAEHRSKRMKEASAETVRRRSSSLQDFFLQWLAELRNDHSNGLLTSSKQLCESSTKVQQKKLFQDPRIAATTVLLKVFQETGNVQVAQMVKDYQESFNVLNPNSPGDWEDTLKQSLSQDTAAKKMIAKTKAGSLNLFTSILTQIVFIDETADGRQELENVDLLFQVVLQNGRGKKKPMSSEKFDPLLCKENLTYRWQTIVFQSREAIVKAISTLVKKKGNKGFVENLIRPRATTLVLKLVALLGTQECTIPKNCKAEMPNFCSLVFENGKDAVVSAYCKVISEYVCSLLEEQKDTTEERQSWFPGSLRGWVDDDAEKTQVSLRLMPTITLTSPGINQTEDQPMCVSELLVSILENSDEHLRSLKKSVEGYCFQSFNKQQEAKEEKKQKRETKKQGKVAAAGLIDNEAAGSSASQDQSSSPPGRPSFNDGVGSNNDHKDDKNGTRDGTDLRSPPDIVCAINTSAPYEMAFDQTRLQYGAARQESHDGLNRGFAPQLTPLNQEFLLNQLSLNHGAVPNALVNMVENGVQFMAKKRFDTYDPSLLASFNDPSSQTKRRKLNEVHMGKIYVALTELMTSHAQALEEHFKSQVAQDWSHIALDPEAGNIIEKARKAHSPTALRSIGKRMLDQPAGKPLGNPSKGVDSSVKNPSRNPTVTPPSNRTPDSSTARKGLTGGNKTPPSASTPTSSTPSSSNKLTRASAVKGNGFSAAKGKFTSPDRLKKRSPTQTSKK